ncbi:MAG: molybdopterin molybdenumtransferase MoeA [Methanoregulaceae archaeon]|nr:molybdopterin molybdenumtransferase MoeA [Methanoregulaceae archaeon]
MTGFLTIVSVGEAVAAVRRIAPVAGVEEIPIEEAAGRILAADAVADTDIPGFSRSTVDGFAVRASDTTGAGDAIPAILSFGGRVAMGSGDTPTVGPGGCVYVPTGGTLPPGSDAVAMTEHAERIGDQVLIRRAVAVGENVLSAGEDFSRGEIALGKGRYLTPQDVGVLAATGNARIKVARMPVAGIISTGNEVVPVTGVPPAGKVRDINSHLVGAFVMSQGGLPQFFGIVRDEREPLRKALKDAVSSCDLVFVSGGSSKDERDMTSSLIGEIGEVLVHGIAIAPGKPTIIGRAGKVPVIGLPGHPASAYIVLQVIGTALFREMLGGGPPACTIRAELAGNVPSARGREEYVRVKLIEGKAYPVFGKSGLLNTLARSDGIIRIPAGSTGLEAGETVEVRRW